jgi:parallel beta-helix repeat protein
VAASKHNPMNKKIAGLFILLLSFAGADAQEILLKKGMIIKRSAKIKKGTYALDGHDSLNRPVIVIEGNNIIIDFNKAILKGSNRKTLPNQFFGLAILVRNGRNITIKNLSARGYKVAIMAQNVEGLKLEHCDLSYNYRQHLNSTQEKEDLSDWMSYHQNEKDEWLRYGAAIYLRDCNNAIINNCRVTGGQNALMMTGSQNATIFNNDFSFNSGIGIGMYRSSSNKVMYNKINFNVRGYSHGVYNRGQDSAGILVYEQSHNNLFFKNSVTHGGDGFFLWAGQSTMDSGQGGCNDNILRGNDFSYAPTNGIEVTFSRNQIIGNRVFECDHGIWGGYSYETAITGNQFRNNRIAIAIEHGQNNLIHDNIFYRDREAIRLWARARQPADWDYARHRDTRSTGYQITTNSFNNIPLVYHFNRTDSLRVFNNLYNNCDQIFKLDSTVTHIDTSFMELTDTTLTEPVIKNPIDPFKGGARLAGRKNILITEWGPYDFGYPLIWNTNPVDTSGTMEFDVLGPKGKWKLISARGVDTFYVNTDSFPATIRVVGIEQPATDIELVAEFRGVAFTDEMGNRIAAGKSHRFSFKKFFLPVSYTVSWYALDSTDNPLKSSPSHPPFKTEKRNRLDYAWWGGISQGEKKHTTFLTRAEGELVAKPGKYELGITWDDAVRVWLDDQLVLDEWDPSKYKFDESPHRTIPVQLTGKHRIRVEHVELGGFATLSLKIRKL